MGKPSLNTTVRLLNQALAKLADSRYEDAERLLLRAKVLAGRKDQRGAQAEIVAVLNALGMVCKYTGRFTRGERYYRRALAAASAAFSPGDPRMASLFHNFGGLEHARGRLAKAETWTRRAVAVRTQALGPNHIEVAADLEALAAILDGRGRHAEAERLHRRAIRLFQGQRSGKAEIALALANLGAGQQKQGKVRGAERTLRRALAMAEASLGQAAVETALIHNNLGKLLIATGRAKAAEEHLREALATLRERLPARHPHVVRVRGNLQEARES
jgi:tetratricopeptide (TPR) repeat protein